MCSLLVPRVRTVVASIHIPQRQFSTSSPISAFPCYIGRTPIPIPPTVVVEHTEDAVQISGPLGTTSIRLEPYIKLAYQNYNPGESAGIPPPPGPNPKGKGKTIDYTPTLFLSVEDKTRRNQRSMWGLTRTLISNSIVGMTEGFSVPLHLVGVGYRAALEPDPRPLRVIEREGGGLPLSGKDQPMRLHMKLGFSHSVYMVIPPHIRAEVPIPTRVMLFCTDKQKLGLFAAKVRALRKPEPYKGKGIFVGAETVRMKSIKKK